MSLLGDFKEIYTALEKAESKTKVVAILFIAFLAMAPLASLADHIFATRVFLHNGVEFYRDYLSNPLSYLFSKFDVKVETYLIDYFLLVCVLFCSLVVKNVYQHEMDKKRRNGILLEGLVRFSSALALIFFIFVYMPDFKFKEQLIIFSIGLFMATYPFMYGYSFKDKVYYFTPMLLSMLMLGLFAALKVALSKPLPIA